VTRSGQPQRHCTDACMWVGVCRRCRLPAHVAGESFTNRARWGRHTVLEYCCRRQAGGLARLAEEGPQRRAFTMQACCTVLQSAEARRFCIPGQNRQLRHWEAAPLRQGTEDVATSRSLTLPRYAGRVWRGVGENLCVLLSDTCRQWAAARDLRPSPGVPLTHRAHGSAARRRREGSARTSCPQAHSHRRRRHCRSCRERTS